MSVINVKKLKGLIKDKNFNIVAFAEKIGVTRQYVHQILKQQKNPTVEVLARMADELDCSLDDLVKR